MDEQVQQGNTENANSIPEEGNQEVSMPDTDQQPAETDGDSGDLPEGVSDRTKQEFEKLKNSNKELAGKLSEYEKARESGSVFDYLSNQVPSTPQQPPQADAKDYSHLNQGQVAQVAQQFVDQYGNVDINRLNAALASANKKAEMAERRVSATEARLLQAEQSRQERETYAKHAWLNPKSPEFDPKGFELVRDRLVRNMWEGKNQHLLDIADDVSQLYQPKATVSAEKEKAVEEYKKSQSTKAQQVPATKGAGQPRKATDFEELRARTVSGDTSALDERLDTVTSIEE